MNKLVDFLYKGVPEDTRYNYKRDLIGNVFSGIFSGIFSAFMAIIARKYYHASAFEISILTCIGFFAGILSFFVTSFVPINKENKAMALMGTTGSLFIVFFSLFAPYDKSWMYIFMVCMFNLCACFGPLYYVILERIYRPEIRAELMGTPKAIGALATVSMTALSTLFINKTVMGYDIWRIAFSCGALCYMGNMYFCFYKMKVPKTDIKQEKPTKFIKEAFALLNKDTLNTWLIVSGIFFTIALTIINTLVPIYQNDILKMEVNQVGYLVLVQNIAWFLGYMYLGKFITKQGNVKGWLITCLFLIMMAMGYILCKNWFILLFFYLFFGLFNAGNDVAWISMVLSVSKGKNVNQYQALHQFFMAIRAAFGMFVATQFINLSENMGFSYKYVFGISICFTVVSMIMVILLFRNKKQKRNADE